MNLFKVHYFTLEVPILVCQNLILKKTPFILSYMYVIISIFPDTQIKSVFLKKDIHSIHLSYHSRPENLKNPGQKKKTREIK